MYTYKNVSYTINQIQEAAKKSNMSVEDYVEKLKADTQPKTDEKVEDADLLDPTTFQTDAAAGAGVVSQPMTASQAGVTELPSEDISLDLQNPKPRYLEFKSGTVVYEDTYLETKAGKPGYPSTFDEYAAAFGTKPKELSVEEVTIKATPSVDKLIELKQVANNTVYNKKTKKFESTGINKELFSFEEESGVKIYNKLFEGSNIDFVETDFGKKQTDPLELMVLGTIDTKGATQLGSEAIKARILNPETGEYVYSETLEFESDGSIINSDRLERFIEANKGIIDVPSWTRSKNKLVGEYKNWLNTEYNPMLKKAEFVATEAYLTNDDLFKPITKTKTAAGYNVSYTYEETVQPYQSDITKEINKLKVKYPNASKKEIEDKAKLNVRTNLYESSRNDAIYNIRQKFIENSSNKDEAQAFLYASETLIKSEEAKAYNESSKKSQIAANQIEENIADGVFVAKVYSQGMSDDAENNKINEIAKKYQIQVVSSTNTISNLEFNSKFNLPKDAKVSENLYNLINAIETSREANANDYKNQVEKSNNAIAKISDLATSMDATAKNYELADKYATNIGLGFSDIGVGIGYLGGSILTLGQSDKLKELGSEYVEYTNKIRNSYVRDVSIDDAFSSAENTSKFVMQEVTNQIPILASMMISGGAASFVIGASSMGGKMMDMENEIATGKADYSGVEVWLKSAGYGLAEGVFSELTTVPILNRAKLNWMGAGKEQIVDSSTKAYFKSQYKGLIYEPTLESVGEIATTGTQNLIDGKPVMQDMKHAGVSGLGFGFAFAAIPFMKGMYNSQFSTYKSREEIRNLQKEIKDLGIKLDKSLLTKTKREIERNIKSKTEELNNKIEEQDYIIKNNFTSGGIKSVSTLINIQADLENQAKEIQADDTIDSDTRAELISDLQNKYNNIIQAKQRALSLRSITGNQTEWEAFKGLDRSKSQEYLDTAESILSGENGGRKVGKEAINAKAYDLYFGDLVREENKKLGRKNSSLFKNFKSFETVEDAIDDLDTQTDLDPKEKQRIIKGLKNGNDGYADPKTKAQVAVVENQVANQRRYTKTHEVGHAAFWELLGSKQNDATFKGISDQLLKTLKSTDEKVYNELIKDGIDDEAGNIDPVEVIARFSEYVAEGKITNVQKAKGIAGLFGVIVQKEFSKDYNFDFRGEQDIFNFVVGMANKIKDGTLTTADIKKAKDSDVIKDLPVSKVDSGEAVTTFSKETSAQASLDVQKIYDEQGVAGAFEILEKFKPITNKIVERRRDAPNFDRQLLTDEIETGKRGIFDLIKEYKPESGVPLAAYINKFLPARAIEASRRVLGEEFTDDVTEAKGVAAEEVAVSIKEEPTRKISPKKLKKYTGVVASNLGVSSSEVSNVIDKAIEADLKAKPIKTFGESRNIGDNLAKTLGKAFGLNPEVFTKKTRNIQKKELDGLRNLRQFLDNNAAKDFSLLPDAYAGPSTIEGKSTFIPNNILNALYRKNDKGKWEKDPTKTVQDYKDLLGKIEGNVYRAAEAQTIKGLAAMSFRNLIVEKAAETAEPKARVDIKAGAKFSGVNKKTLNQIAQAKNINEATKLAGIKNRITVNDTNRAKKQEQMLDFIVSGNIPSIIFEAGKFGNFGKWNRRGKIVNGVLIPLPKPATKYFKTKDGKLIKEGSKEYALAEKNGDFLATRGGLYYGVKDPAYIEALQASRENDSKYPKLQKAKRVNEKNAFTEKGQKQSDVNLDTLQVMAEVLADAVHSKGMPIEIAALYISSSYQATTGIIKLAGKFKYRSEKMEYGPADSKSGQRTGAKFREEHNPPASTIGAYLIYAISKNEVKPFMSIIRDNYYQTLLSKADDHKLDMAKLDSRLPEGTSILDNSAIRLIEAGIDINSLINPFTNKTMAEELGVSLNKSDRSLDNIAEQNKLLKDLILEEGVYKNPQAYLNDFVKLSSKTNASKINNKNTPSSIKFSRSVTNQEALDNLSNIDKALSIARNPDAPVKKIRVFDFDDTLATTKSNVLYEMPDGKTGSLTATEFAKRAGEMEAEGAEWDFSEFSKVMKGAKGPLLDVAKFISDAKGERDIFVLTARPQDAAGPIKEFLDSMGLNIPLENITGLGDGTAQAKARWMVDKAAEGYNDFYFADDASKNVKAVKDALSVLDVKSKVQQAYVKFSKASNLSKDFNKIIENATGIASEKVYGKAKAQVAGASRGKVFRGIAYSAQDFVGLLYETLGKGKEGDAQMAWYKQNLLDPYARAMNDLSSARLAMMNDYRALKKQLGIVPKNLRKKIPGDSWTKEQAVRVYVWSRQGTEVPGISKNDLKDLNSFVTNNAELQVFADQLIAIQKGDMYPEPGESWVSGGISTDMLKGLNTVKRTKYLEQWQRNVDAIFSKENKNKLEAAYGIKYVKALENSLERMKTGRNRSFSDDSLTGRFTDWLQGSVGAIMFFNTRSAVLQTLSAVNFVNFTDNNPYAAAKAFANQKQYWKDFTTLMNSDFLKERRSGLRINVNEADIADMAKQEGPRGVINKLLQLGFAPTQIADSFAIASGGATFYRNRIKTYTKQGLDQAQAEEKAFQDFRENAEESQQSSRPDKISAQQAGPLGRLILAFANTPAQYARLTDKAIRDLKNKRGDAKTNISKIIYYTTVQNLIFNAVQQALFAMAFGDEEPEDEEKQKKYVSIANGMADSLLRGTGIAGSVISVGKNAVIRIINESEKKRPKYEKVGYELTKISPPVSAKLSRINQAARAYEWNKEEMMTKGFSLDNPAFLAGGNVVSALTNIPLDRVIKKVNNVTKATESDMELWERVALFAGWQDWELGIKDESKSIKKKKTKSKKRRSGGITFDEF